MTHISAELFNVVNARINPAGFRVVARVSSTTLRAALLAVAELDRGAYGALHEYYLAIGARAGFDPAGAAAAMAGQCVVDALEGIVADGRLVSDFLGIQQEQITAKEKS